MTAFQGTMADLVKCLTVGRFILDKLDVKYTENQFIREEKIVFKLNNPNDIEKVMFAVQYEVEGTLYELFKLGDSEVEIRLAE